MFKYPPKLGEDDDNTYLSDPFQKKPGYTANFGITKPNNSSFLRPISRIPQIPETPEYTKPKPFTVNSTFSPDWSIDGRTKFAPTVNYLDGLRPFFADNVEFSQLALVGVALAASAIASPLLGIGMMKIAVPLWATGTIALAADRSNFIDKRATFIETKNGRPTLGEDFGGYASTIHPRVVDKVDTIVHGAAESFISNPYGYVSKYAVDFKDASEKEAESRQKALQHQPNQNAVTTTQNYFKANWEDVRNFGENFLKFPGHVIDDVTENFKIPRAPGESDLKHAGKSLYTYAMEGAKTETADKRGRTAFGRALDLLIPAGEIMARNIGTGATMAGLGQLYGVTPPWEEITYVRALENAGIKDDALIQAVKEFEATSEWDEQLAPLPNLTDYIGSWYNYSLNRGSNTFYDLPAGVQIASMFLGPTASKSAQFAIGRLFLQGEAGAYKKLGLTIQPLIATVMKNIPNEALVFTGDLAYNTSQFAQYNRNIRIAKHVVTINNSTLLTPGATPDTVIKMINDTEALDAPSTWKTFRRFITEMAPKRNWPENTIARLRSQLDPLLRGEELLEANEEIAYEASKLPYVIRDNFWKFLSTIDPTPVVRSLATRTTNSMANMVQKFGVDYVQELFNAVGQGQHRALFEAVINMGDYVPGMDMSNNPAMARAVDQLRLWFPDRVIDPALVRELKLGVDTGNSILSTGGLIARKIIKEIHELGADRNFLAQIELADISRRSQAALEAATGIQANKLSRELQATANQASGEILRLVLKSIHKSMGTTPVAPDMWRKAQGIASVWQILVNMGAAARNFTMDAMRLLVTNFNAGNANTRHAVNMGLVTSSEGRSAAIEGRDYGVAGVFDSPKLSKLKEFFTGLYSKGEGWISDRYTSEAIFKYLNSFLKAEGLTSNAGHLVSQLPLATQKQLQKQGGLYSPEMVDRWIANIKGDEAGLFSHGVLGQRIWDMFQHSADSGSGHLDHTIINDVYHIYVDALKNGLSAFLLKRKLSKYIDGVQGERQKVGQLVIQQQQNITQESLWANGWNKIFGDAGKTQLVLKHNNMELTFNNILDKAAYYVGQSGELDQNIVDAIRNQAKSSGIDFDILLETGKRIYADVTRTIGSIPIGINQAWRVRKATNVPVYLQTSDSSIWLASEEKRVLEESAISYYQTAVMILFGKATEQFKYMGNKALNLSEDIEYLDFNSIKFSDTESFGQFMKRIVGDNNLEWMPTVDGLYDWSRVPVKYAADIDSNLVDFIRSHLLDLRTSIGAQISKTESAVETGAKITGPWADDFYNAGGLLDPDQGIRALYAKYIPEVIDTWKNVLGSVQELFGNLRTFEVPSPVDLALAVELNGSGVGAAQRAQLKIPTTMEAVYNLLEVVDAEYGVMVPRVSNDVSGILDQIGQHAKGVLSQARIDAKQIGTGIRDIMLLDYSDKFGFDVNIMERVFGYPYWYLRSWSDYPYQIIKDPFYLSMMHRVNNFLMQMNEDKELPRYRENALQINVPFSLQEMMGAKTISVPIANAIIPFTNILNGSNTNTAMNQFPGSAVFNKIYGIGPSAHVLIGQIYALGLLSAEIATGNPQYGYEAQEFFGHIGPVQRMVSSALAKVRQSGLQSAVLPEGIDVLPDQIDVITNAATGIYLFNEARKIAGLASAAGELGGLPAKIALAAGFLVAAAPISYAAFQWTQIYTKMPDGTYLHTGTTNNRKATAKYLYDLGGREDVPGLNFRVTPEIIKQAALIAAQPYDVRHIDRKEFTNALALYKHAVRQSQADKWVKDVVAWVGGPAADILTDQDIEREKMYTEAQEIQLKGDKPTTTPEELKRLWSEYGAKYPLKPVFSIMQKDEKKGFDAYAYDVLSRVGPGDFYSVLNSVGLSGDLINKFYNDKGSRGFKADTERKVFDQGIIRLGIIIKGPAFQTISTWNESFRLKKQLDGIQNGKYPGTWGEQAAYYQLPDKEKPQFLETHLNLKERLLEQTQMILEDPEYRDALGPYYVSLEEAESLLLNNFMQHPNRGINAADVQQKGIYYRALLAYSSELKDAQQRAQFIRFYHLEDYDRDYKHFSKNLPAMINELLAGMIIPEMPELTGEYPTPEIQAKVQATIQKHWEKIQEQTRERNLQQSLKPESLKPGVAPKGVNTMPPSGNQPRRLGKKLVAPPEPEGIPDWTELFHMTAEARSRRFLPVSTTPTPSGEPVTLQGVYQQFLDHQDEEGVITHKGYVAKLSPGFINNTIDWYKGAGLSPKQIVESWSIPIANSWPVIETPDKDQQLQRLLNYVRSFPNSYSLREAMMREGSQEGADEGATNKRRVWARVIGTVRALEDRDIVLWSKTYPNQLGDLSLVRDQALNYLYPTMNAYFDILGFNVTYNEDGSSTLSAQEVKGKTAEDRFSTKEVENYIHETSITRFGPDIEQKYDHYLFLATTAGPREAAMYYRQNSEIGKYQIYREQVWDRYNEAKKPEDDKKKRPGGYGGKSGGGKPYDPMQDVQDVWNYIEKINKFIRVKNPKQEAFDNAHQVSSGRGRTKSYSSIGTRGYPIVPYRQRKANGAAYMSVIAEMRQSNPLLAGAFRDFMEANSERRMIIMQSNPDLARWMTGMSSESFIKLEDSYRAGVITSESNSKNQANVLKVYPAPTGRTGL